MREGLIMFLITMFIFAGLCTIVYLEWATSWGHLWMVDNYNLIINFMCDIYNNTLNTIREIL
jgi:hypothetical protein